MKYKNDFFLYDFYLIEVDPRTRIVNFIGAKVKLFVQGDTRETDGLEMKTKLLFNENQCI